MTVDQMTKTTYFQTIFNQNVEMNEKNIERDLSLEQYWDKRNCGVKMDINRVNFLTEKDVRKAFMNNSLVVSAHTQDGMQQRGYTKRDLIALTWNGVRTELQFHNGISYKAVIEGLDSSNNPICMVVGVHSLEEYKATKQLHIVTVFPPTKEKFIRKVTDYKIA